MPVPYRPRHASIRPNWPAIVVFLAALAFIGGMAGVIASSPDGLTLRCPEEDWVQVVGNGTDIGDGNHVTVYCDAP